MTADERKSAAAIDLLGEKLFLAVAGDNARVSAAVLIAAEALNARIPDREILRVWFASPREELDGKAPIAALATAPREDLERLTAVLIVAARGF